MYAQVAIIGAGLSGLHTAFECQKLGIDYCLIEARDRIGGRILSSHVNQTLFDASQAAIDLGPSWFWPGQQRIQSVIHELGLDPYIIHQYSNGTGIYEDNQGNIQRGVDGISMAGAFRIKGGLGHLAHGLVNTLDTNRVFTASPVSNMSFHKDTIEIKTTSHSLTDIACKYAVLAMPPRVALATIEFLPTFNRKRTRQLNDIATWMAGHAKLICVYQNDFWRKQGFSGDVISQKGPLQEIHDASSEDGRLNALFGFVGVAPANRQQHEESIKQLAIAQLARIFGDDASHPVKIVMQDWSTEIYTATQYDQEIQRFHSMNNVAHVQEEEWNNQLIWSGTECADYTGQNNGFLEGALESSMTTLKLLMDAQ